MSNREEILQAAELLEAAADRVAACETGGLIWTVTTFLQALEQRLDPAEFRALLAELLAELQERLGE